ncbi:MAG: hypothetical protein HZA50_14765 [Planctomycetes bacterium]|nr:hypothetical protein [Planctomycetota bacterium]
MSDPFAKVSPGQSLKIPASAYNTFVDAAKNYQNQKFDQSQTARPALQQNTIILVRNDSGADRGRFDVLGISGPVFSPADDENAFINQPALCGVSPTSENHAGKFVILLEPITAGQMGRACIDGMSIVRLEVDKQTDKFADVKSGDPSTLKSCLIGSARILWKDSGTAWALVRMGEGGLPVPEDDDFQTLVWINKEPQFQKPRQCP